MKEFFAELSRFMAYGAGAGFAIAVVSVIADEVCGYLRMKRFAKAAAQKRTGRGLFSE